ncbi:MAG: hypothetical protein Q9196_004047 [Gyalolechia fulgens]
MCGTPGGLIGMIQDGLNKSLSENSQVDDKKSISEPARLQSVFETNDWKMPPSEAVKVREDIVEAPAVPIEPSLATEGALWFPDLLVPDPHLILPFILSATMFANISYQERTAKKTGLTPGAFQRRLGNAFKIVVLAVGPLTLAVPSAIHVYWISSSAFALASNIVLNWYSPTVQPRKPKRAERGEEQTSIVWESEARQIRSILEQRQRNKSQTSP